VKRDLIYIFCNLLNTKIPYRGGEGGPWFIIRVFKKGRKTKLIVRAFSAKRGPSFPRLFLEVGGSLFFFTHRDVTHASFCSGQGSFFIYLFRPDIMSDAQGPFRGAFFI